MCRGFGVSAWISTCGYLYSEIVCHVLWSLTQDGMMRWNQATSYFVDKLGSIKWFVFVVYTALYNSIWNKGCLGSLKVLWFSYIFSFRPVFLDGVFFWKNLEKKLTVISQFFGMWVWLLSILVVFFFSVFI